jgi:hypothetical protein
MKLGTKCSVCMWATEHTSHDLGEEEEMHGLVKGTGPVFVWVLVGVRGGGGGRAALGGVRGQEARG